MKTYIVDAFTDQAFAGNPAGVCLPEQILSNAQMLSIAQELGLSETAFVSTAGSAQANACPNIWDIRYFSPVMEIPLCGHATLAAAKVQLERLQCQDVTFTNIQDIVLPVRERAGLLEMTLPLYTTSAAQAPTELLAALGLEQPTNVEYNKETNILLIEISSAATLAKLSPDFERLRRAHDSINGVLVTAAGDDSYDYHSRYFWPWSGTNEDPATGGTQTFLASYWAKRLGKTSLQSYQASARTGSMQVNVMDSSITICSQARIVLEGRMRL